ncbi:MAG: hypothetical protein ACTSWL_08145 [Promethearchaeota archaeon]
MEEIDSISQELGFLSTKMKNALLKQETTSKLRVILGYFLSEYLL